MKSKCLTKITVFWLICVISMNFSSVTKAAQTEVTREKENSMKKIVDATMQYIVRHATEADDNLVFNNRCKTTIATFITEPDKKDLSHDPVKIKENMKQLFGTSKDYTMKNDKTYPNRSFVIVNGKVMFDGGEFGDAYPRMQIADAVQKSHGTYTVLAYAQLESRDYGEGGHIIRPVITTYGSYIYTLKEAKNIYGYIITNIKQTGNYLFGEYQCINKGLNDALYINSVAGNSFSFSITDNSSKKEVKMEGMATFTNNFKNAVFNDGKGFELSFVMDEDRVTIKEKLEKGKVNPYGGAGVTFNGVYERR